MKWMRWSWRDLQDCPADIVEKVIGMMNEEAEEQEG